MTLARDVNGSVLVWVRRGTEAVFVKKEPEPVWSQFPSSGTGSVWLKPNPSQARTSNPNPKLKF